MIRQESVVGSSPSGVLTVTGVVPDLNAAPRPPTPALSEAAPSNTTYDAKGDEVVNHLLCHTRYLLTLKGRPPFGFAGMETYERLQGVAALSFNFFTHRRDRRLVHLYQGLKDALAPFAQTYAALQQGAVWVRDMADILAPPGEPALSAAQVSGALSGYLGAVRRQHELSPMLHAFRRHLDTVSQSYWPGLFHCYDVPGLARTNNELESHFRDTQRRLLRTTGQKGQTKRTLHRLGAWELLERPLSEAEAVEELSHIPATDLAQERQRLRQHCQRFRFQVRSRPVSDAQFEHLRQQWWELPKRPAG
jgi:hypothetical protein